VADPAPLRRRFQFHLLTVLIGVSVIGLVAWWTFADVRIARNRVSILAEIKKHGGDHQPQPGRSDLSFIRRLCGDQHTVVIWRSTDKSGPTEDEINATFPKVQILVASNSPSSRRQSTRQHC
jgi:hypothetical protein